MLNGLRLQLGTFSIDAKTTSSNYGDSSQSMTSDTSVNQLEGEGEKIAPTRNAGRVLRREAPIEPSLTHAGRIDKATKMA